MVLYRPPAHRAHQHVRGEPGANALSLCTTAHPLFTRPAMICNASISETAMRLNPRAGGGRSGGGGGGGARPDCCVAPPPSGIAPDLRAYLAALSPKPRRDRTPGGGVAAAGAGGFVVGGLCAISRRGRLAVRRGEGRDRDPHLEQRAAMAVSFQNNSKVLEHALNRTTGVARETCGARPA